MEQEQKFFAVLSLIIFANSVLLIVKFLLIWSFSSPSLCDYLGLLWPVIGIAIIYEFLRSKRDQWGWGGLLFHIFILYCAIYYIIEFIIGISNYSIELSLILYLIIYLIISSLGWIGFFYYYD